MEQRQRSGNEELHALRQIRVTNHSISPYSFLEPYRISVSLCLSDLPGGVRASASHVRTHLSSRTIEGTVSSLKFFFTF